MTRVQISVRPAVPFFSKYNQKLHFYKINFALLFNQCVHLVVTGYRYWYFKQEICLNYDFYFIKNSLTNDNNNGCNKTFVQNQSVTKDVHKIFHGQNTSISYIEAVDG